MRILIVEDDPLTALVIQQTVIDLGLEALVAHSVADAASWIAGVGVDAAILDVGLPDGHGFTLARALRSERLPFVFATGQFIGDHLGFADIEVIAKPFDRTQLKAAISRLARAARGTLQGTLPRMPENVASPAK